MDVSALPSFLSPLQRRATDLLRNDAAAALFAPVDLVAIALLLKPDAYVEGKMLAHTLTRYGYTGAPNIDVLAKQLDHGAHHCSALQPEGRGFALKDPSLVVASANVAIVRADQALGARDTTRRPPVRGDKIETRPAAPDEFTKASDRVNKQSTRTATRSEAIYEPTWVPPFDVWDGRGVTAEEVRELASRHKAAKRPSERASNRPPQRHSARPQQGTRDRVVRGVANPVPQEPAVLPKVPVTPPRVVMTAPDEAVLGLLLAGSGPKRTSSDLDHVRLVRRALAISSAEQFHDLWSTGGLNGVDSHPYQIETVRRVLRSFRGRALLADEVGLGKTIEALMVLREYQMRGMVRRALVLVPPALVHHWVGELAEKGGIEARTTLGAEVRREEGDFWDRPGVVVASLALARSERHAERVAKVEWDLVIVDEAHHVKNRRTLGYQLINRLKSRFLLLLTATPVETDLEELYNLVTLLKPGQFATPTAFRNEYVDAKDPTSPRNREKLRALLSEVMVRNTRADSGLELPPRFVTTIAVDPVDAEQELYAKVLELVRRHKVERRTRMATTTLLFEAGSSPTVVAGTAERVLANMKYSSEFRKDVESLLVVARRVTEPKKDRVIAELLSAERDQVLVFTRFRDAAAQLARTLEEAGIGVAQYHGGLGAEEKRSVLDRFRSGLRCVVATEVGGEGQNLQFCRLLVNYDLPWNPMLIEQRIGRLHRMGQKHPVQVYNFCTRGTVEERLLDVLDRRLHLFELVVGEIDMVLGNLADERDLEERILDLYTHASAEDDIARGFDAIAEDLARARSRYEHTRALDAALFQRDYES